MRLFAEGIFSSLLPCSYSILIPALALVILRKNERIPTLGIFAAATVVSAWIRAAGISDLLADRVWNTAVLVAGLVLSWMVSHRAAGTAGSVLIGVFAGSTWFPCVGEQLGEVLGRAPDEPLSGLALLAVYLVGVMLPIVAVVTLVAYVPAVRRRADGRWAAVAARAVLGAMGVLVLSGQYPVLLSTLARWSVL